jgi:hypothetical protein
MEPFHHGLLNHKMEIENLHKTAEELSNLIKKQNQFTVTHQVLYSAQDAKHKSLKNEVTVTQESTSALDTVTVTQKHIESNIDQILFPTCRDSNLAKCVFISAVPITKLFACVGGETMEDMCYERLRAEACVD